LKKETEREIGKRNWEKGTEKNWKKEN